MNKFIFIHWIIGNMKTTALTAHTLRHALIESHKFAKYTEPAHSTQNHDKKYDVVIDSNKSAEPSIAFVWNSTFDANYFTCNEEGLELLCEKVLNDNKHYNFGKNRYEQQIIPYTDPPKFAEWYTDNGVHSLINDENTLIAQIIWSVGNHENILELKPLINLRLEPKISVVLVKDPITNWETPEKHYDKDIQNAIKRKSILTAKLGKMSQPLLDMWLEKSKGGEMIPEFFWNKLPIYIAHKEWLYKTGKSLLTAYNKIVDEINNIQ